MFIPLKNGIYRYWPIPKFLQGTGGWGRPGPRRRGAGPGDAAGGAGRPCGTGAAGGAGAGGGGRRAGGAGVVVRIPPPGDVGIPCEEWWFNGDLMVINDD